MRAASSREMYSLCTRNHSQVLAHIGERPRGQSEKGRRKCISINDVSGADVPKAKIEREKRHSKHTEMARQSHSQHSFPSNIQHSPIRSIIIIIKKKFRSFRAHKCEALELVCALQATKSEIYTLFVYSVLLCPSLESLLLVRDMNTQATPNR